MPNMTSQYKKLQRVLVSTVSLCLVLSAAALHGQDWNQWRGAARDGVSQGAAWPDSLAPESLREAWRHEALGPSYSSPVIHDGIIYTTEGADSASEGVIAVHEATGERLWSRSWPIRFAMPQFMEAHGDWPKSTPAVDGDDLLFLGIAEHLQSLDAKTGELRWSLDFPQRFKTPVPEFGASSSPLISKDSIYVQAAGSLFALDRQTGEVRWRALNLFQAVNAPEDDLEAYGSPILTTIAGVEQVVVHTVEGLAGVHARSGDVLWLLAADPGDSDSPNITPALWIPEPTPEPSSRMAMVLTTTESSGSPMFRITQKGQEFTVEEAWRSKVHGNMASPVVVGDHAYLPLKNGRLAYLDLKTGQEVWISKPFFGSYASAVTRGDKILLLSTDGELHLVTTEAGKMRTLDTRRVAERTWAHLTAHGNRVYVRSQDALLAFEWSAPHPEPAGSE